jgi:spore maturation protein CgeB
VRCFQKVYRAMTTLSKLAEQMKKDWDRRVGHDYRFWMSDGHRDDKDMWQTGERDFSIISADVTTGHNLVALDVGCGVGRMLRAASQQFGKVIGFDVSQRAIDKARELLGANPAVDLVVGSGFDLQPIADASVDFVWSYAALTSMPIKVIATYLVEMKRVLKPTGNLALQVYLGTEVAVRESDTLHLRCLNEENFKKAMELAGFALTTKRELILPNIQVSFKEQGLEALIVTLTPTDRIPASPEDIAHALLPGGESDMTGDLAPSDLEAWMTADYAKQLIEAGDVDKARRAVEYVEVHCRTTTIDVRDILDQVMSKSGVSRAAIDEQSSSASGLLFEQNLRVLAERFPSVSQRLQSHRSVAPRTVSCKVTQQGPAIWSGPTCLDHPEKPVAGAEAFVQRTLSEKRIVASDHLVVLGFGGGYHLEAFIKRDFLVSCLEPSVDALKMAMEVRDLRPVFERLHDLQVAEGYEATPLSARSQLVVRPQTLTSDRPFVEKVKSSFYGRRGTEVLKPRMAVLGPIMGGTLPIGQYTYSALTRMGQHARGVDMSGFNPGFQLLDGFSHDERRKSQMRGMYCEMLSKIVLEMMDEKPIDILICMAQAPITMQALTELRKRGVITVLWFVEDYLRFPYWQQMAPYYDFMFTIQKGDCLDKIRAAGTPEVHYLPTACDPFFHRPLELSDEDRKKWGSHLSFVGAGYHNRQQMFASLASADFRIWGSEWPTCRPFDRMVQDNARRIAPEEYIKIFNATNINLNLHSSTERDGVEPNGDFLNPRTFELASCGAFQLIDERTLLPEAFEVGKEVVTFSSLPDLKDKIAYYTEHPEERALVASQGRARALKDHTYDKRLQQMLSIIYASRYEELRGREQKSPWTPMLKKAERFPELLTRCEASKARGEEANLDGLISDIVTGNGKLTDTEQKLLFLFHVRKQIIRMTREEAGLKN